MELSPLFTPVSEAINARLRERATTEPCAANRDAGVPEGPVVSFATFMDVALYDPELGYYRRPRTRVGRAGADFYTASSMDRVFGPLVAAAARSLLPAGAAREFTFVEVGAETAASTLAGIDHGFRDVRVVRVGEPPALEGEAVVFSNELFDAQPFHRLRYRAGEWRELGVAIGTEGVAWCELTALSPPVARAQLELPAGAPEGYVLDLPLASAALAQELCRPTWRGLFLAFDYGRGWAQLLEDYPSGTGRAYAAHRQSGDLLEHAGEQDLTCHVCWDWLEAALRDNEFGRITRESQEAFFVRRATEQVQAILTSQAAPLSPERTQLKQLLHPALMGQRFEVLWGLRM